MKQKPTTAEATHDLIARLLNDPKTTSVALATKVIHVAGSKLAIDIAFHIVQAISTIHSADGKPLPAEMASTVDKAQTILLAFRSSGFGPQNKPLPQ